ncbi:AEC family transporter [Seohaeicola zhoushanensis]|uniref:Transporter n=1 Tax=Seohaeicola zhoushanensis TaxID=1569283 RepID=A0A8J3GV79_9RHOB|nr:AEC family transporter [Seohaeicola zhoushanensis]GHF37951.1 transporter [Seohaeicola zhoushanensis]
MAAILSITFPIYAAIALGYVIVARGMFSRADMRVLGQYVVNIAMPALLFRAIVARPLTEIADPGYILTILVGALVTIALSFAWFTLTAPDKARRAVAVMGTVCPNSGFVGYPVMLLVLPDLAGLVLALNMLVENVIVIPICLILLDLTRPRDEVHVAAVIGRILRDLLKRPMILAILAGLAASAMELTLPVPVDRFLQMVANASAALALLVIGGSLVGLPMHGNRVMALQIAAGKLLLHPAVVVGVILALGALAPGLLSPDMARAAILTAAVPMFGIYAVLAQERGLEGAAALAQLAATSGAFVTLSLALYWLT